ncbi:hypothetical protein SCH4B_0318 [Ruegeria sp. TrichCH4B]|nr:hypothetical protein SCH4B_0318 [Ruegeria sp. TrichCH4B]
MKVPIMFIVISLVLERRRGMVFAADLRHFPGSQASRSMS